MTYVGLPEIEKLWAIGANLIPGYGSVVIWGRCPDLGLARRTVCEFGGAGFTYSFPAAAATLCISSSQAGDNQRVRVTGLDADWNPAQVVGVLNGHSQVALAAALLRVNLVEVLDLGLAGDIYVAPATSCTGGVPDNLSVVLGYVSGAGGAQRSLQAVYSVPAGKKLIPVETEITVCRTPGLLPASHEGLAWIVYKLPGVTPPMPWCMNWCRAWRDGQSSRQWLAGRPVPEKTDMRLEALSYDAGAQLIFNATCLLVDASVL